MGKDQAFFLGLLRVAQTVLDELRLNPSSLKEDFPIFPTKFNRLDLHSLRPGMPIYNLQSKPKFKGFVEKVEPSKKDPQKYVIFFVCGHTQEIDKDASVFTCCNCH